MKRLRKGLRPRSNNRRLLCDGRKVRLLPGVEASDYVDYILEAGPLQQAASNHAAIASLAVHSNGNVAIDFRGRDFKVIQGPPGSACNVTGFPFGLAADVQHLQALAPTPSLRASTLICGVVAKGNPAWLHASMPPFKYPRASSRPTRASLIRASDTASCDSAIKTGRAAKPSNAPAHEANCPDNAIFTDPGTCPAAN